jgi:hypothetical protein
VVNFVNSTSGHFLTVNGIPLQMYTTACSVLQFGLCRENCVKDRNGNFSGLIGFQHVNAAAGSRIFPAEFQVFVCVGGGGGWGCSCTYKETWGAAQTWSLGHGWTWLSSWPFIILPFSFSFFSTFSLYCSPLICLFASLSLQISC